MRVKKERMKNYKDKIPDWFNKFLLLKINLNKLVVQ